MVQSVHTELISAYVGLSHPHYLNYSKHVTYIFECNRLPQCWSDARKEAPTMPELPQLDVINFLDTLIKMEQVYIYIFFFFSSFFLFFLVTRVVLNGWIQMHQAVAFIR